MASLNYNMTRTKVYIFLTTLAVIAVIVMAMVIMSKKSDHVSEHFTESGLADYNARLTTINVFDAYMKRNPTPVEIDKYSSFKNEQDILSAVMGDFPEAATNTQKKQDMPTLQPDVMDKDDAIASLVVEEEMPYTSPPLTRTPRVEMYEDAAKEIGVKNMKSALQLLSDIRDDSTDAVKSLNRKLNQLEDLLLKM